MPQYCALMSVEDSWQQLTNVDQIIISPGVAPTHPLVKMAKEKNIDLIPFLLEGVAGNPDLNLPDGIHPTPEGHRIVMETLWPFISKAL
jgi:hypothetical protein